MIRPLLFFSVISLVACSDQPDGNSAGNQNGNANDTTAMDSIAVDTAVTQLETQKVVYLDEAYVLTFDPDPDDMGSGDWGFFVNDVWQYLDGKGIRLGGTIGEDFDSVEVTLDDGKVKYIDLSEYEEGGVKGYVLIYGDSEKFVQHDMPDAVISEINDFFGLKP